VGVQSSAPFEEAKIRILSASHGFIGPAFASEACT
jgi:hypothetical protein